MIKLCIELCIQQMRGVPGLENLNLENHIVRNRSYRICVKGMVCLKLKKCDFQFITVVRWNS